MYAVDYVEPFSHNIPQPNMLGAVTEKPKITKRQPCKIGTHTHTLRQSGKSTMVFEFYCRIGGFLKSNVPRRRNAQDIPVVPRLVEGHTRKSPDLFFFGSNNPANGRRGRH